jgi:hypothetical protein
MKDEQIDRAGTGSVNAMKETFTPVAKESVPDSIQRDASIAPDKGSSSLDTYNATQTRK